MEGGGKKLDPQTSGNLTLCPQETQGGGKLVRSASINLCGLQGVISTWFFHGSHIVPTLHSKEAEEAEKLPKAVPPHSQPLSRAEQSQDH